MDGQRSKLFASLRHMSPLKRKQLGWTQLRRSILMA